jgi:hypothetical protein
MKNFEEAETLIIEGIKNFGETKELMMLSGELYF